MEATHRVLVVDDDADIRDLLVFVLEQAGLEVSWAETGEDALAKVREHQPDLVTLDLTLPDMDGTEVCRRLREFSDAYVVMITGRASETDRLVGLEVGADDYMNKPFSPREVLARVSALLRRPRLGAPSEPASSVEEPAPVAGPADAELDVGGGLVLDSARHVATLDGERVMLTPAEFDLLRALATRPGEAWEREELVREVWQGEFIESDFLVDVHIANLRRKLRRAGSRTTWIRTVGGASYLYDPS
ncbi:DNA-binding response regulator [Nocardioides szechwanensis]|uniref:DNA-binding response regulator, OmpR family, contains REC and winged-helix (WHTH) domain n=1 Tax=Nocardioides szechwanensis TaxID=1005944 RepID=A0A1G9WBU2_9ACTN|nr:response regulator transcription factor [Nocardioides szechwanensis]GEP32684.1 DNA-binding response regulator [Nocardioides szechwanensis]SDM81743.1 DNA-binding response regulator, OmpR family, contains REC and winged-helix (wHTH) domain [Nocardioides szechwanensis]